MLCNFLGITILAEFVLAQKQGIPILFHPQSNFDIPIFEWWDDKVICFFRLAKNSNFHDQ